MSVVQISNLTQENLSGSLPSSKVMQGKAECPALFILAAAQSIVQTIFA
jgi:hypothetical protein